VTWAERLRLKYGSCGHVSTLSGGNQQKVVPGSGSPGRLRCLIIDEPTRGIDVGTKAECTESSTSWPRRDGVLMISSELPEVLGVADRVLVIHEGG